MEARTNERAGAPILVTGGTGTLGRLVVARFLAAGSTVRVLSRRPGESRPGLEALAGDLATGEGIDAAFVGIRTVVHCAGTAKGDELKARTLVQAAKRAGIAHLVFISVVGADRIPIRGRIDRAMFGYFGSKVAAERVIAESGLPWTTLRATQFHELFLKTAQGLAKLPIVPLPAGFRFQPIAADEVANRLVELALGAPQGLVAEMGGPRVSDMADLVQAYLRATNRHRAIVRVPTMGGAARAFRAGANLTPDRAVGIQTWEEFVAERVGPARQVRSVAPG